MPRHITPEQARALGIIIPADRPRKPPPPKVDEEHTRRMFLAACEAWGLPRPIPEYEFARPRKWRFDYAWKQRRLALEIQGGLFTGGRHVRGDALLAEHEKLNAAAIRGWRVLYCTPDDVKSGAVFALLSDALKGRSRPT